MLLSPSGVCGLTYFQFQFRGQNEGGREKGRASWPVAWAGPELKSRETHREMESYGGSMRKYARFWLKLLRKLAGQAKIARRPGAPRCEVHWFCENMHSLWCLSGIDKYPLVLGSQALTSSGGGGA